MAKELGLVATGDSSPLNTRAYATAVYEVRYMSLLYYFEVLERRKQARPITHANDGTGTIFVTLCSSEYLRVADRNRAIRCARHGASSSGNGIGRVYRTTWYRVS